MKITADQEIINTCGQLLIDLKLTIAFAESATAGRLCAEFGLVEHAGTFLKGGLVCYDAELKKTLLNVPDELIKKYTPESPEVTSLITEGLRELIPADIHLGCTGLTCPGGSETEEKPVGTIFICALQGQDVIFSERLWFPGSPEEIILSTVESVAKMLVQHLARLKF